MAKKKNYVNNAEFYEAMVEYKKRVKEAEDCGDSPPEIPNYIGECIYQIANRLSRKPNFMNYSYRDDMISDGLENAIMAINNFDPEKSKNPFAYFTQIIYFAFLRRIQKEKKQLYVKHKVIENSVLTDTAVERNGVDNVGDAAFIDLDNEYMADFVESYEQSMKKKRDKSKGEKENEQDSSTSDH